jgi:hypothetical protein
MNIQQLRQSLKLKWVNYYYKNRSWLVKMKIWATYDGHRRPSSGFILAALSALEPQLEQLFPFILELNNNPDQIVAALGLNFNPEEQLHLVKDNFVADNQERHGSSDKSATERLSSHINQASQTTRLETQEPGSSSTSIKEDKEESRDAQSTPITQSKAVQPTTVGTKAPNKAKSIIPITLTKAENSSVISIAVAGIETKSKPLTSLAIASKAKNHSNVTLENGVTTKVQRKSLLSPSLDCNVLRKTELAPTKVKDIHNIDSNIPPKNKACKLANWIDDFCQGKEWDRDEAVYIRF